uniref:neuronal PAS domain-containing protein 4A-like n=1 Tax=Euleptes europaea TaxID=460621 RepID=UPI00253FCDB8|nr:neuronal PAS domain-containing protein 4A-like [Euleptes europaea]
MTILCESCSRPVKTESCHSRCTSASRRDPRTPKPFRSTKGASKARRDQINAELQDLRSLLPISEQEKERLSYLHTMALVCFYMRETQLFPPGSRAYEDGAPATAVVDPELLLSLPGFILALTANGKYAYVSENVSNFLGFSVVELLAHGDSIFDLLNSPGSRTMQEKLCFAQQHPGTETEVITEMRTSRSLRARYGGRCFVALRGRFLSLDPQLTSTSPISTFVAFCTPVAHLPESGDHTFWKLSFQSLHTLDMKIAEVTESVIYYLGYHKEELIHQSWYSFLHPEDVCSAAELHMALVNGAEERNQQAVVRMLCKDLSWAWVQVISSRENGKTGELVICTNHILSEEEAMHIQSQKPQAATSPPTTLRQCTRETEQQTQPNDISVSPQESLMPGDGTLQYNRSQILDACAKKILPVPLQPQFPVTFPIPHSANMQPPEETGLSLSPDDWHKNLSCTDGAKRLPTLSPCAFCSPESTLSPASSPSADFSPLPPSTEMFQAKDTGADPYRWAISVLADQIHSLAETFSQYTKQIPQEIPPSIPLWPSQPPENSQTNGALDVMEEFPVDEQIITTILNNLLDNGNLNLSPSELVTANNFHISDSEPQLSLLQTPLAEAPPCLNQCLFPQPLSSSASADCRVPDSQWDARFHITFHQGAPPEEALFS